MLWIGEAWSGGAPPLRARLLTFEELSVHEPHPGPDQGEEVGPVETAPTRLGHRSENTSEAGA